MATPRIVKSLLEDDWTEKELKAYIKDQRRAYNGLLSKAIDFEGWLAFKLSCTKRQAVSVLKWAKR